MTDFYALLKQSILDRGIKDAQDRGEIYAQARRAVVKQLWDFRPPLAADEIDQRVGAYDTAVERIEADLKVVFANGAPRPNGAKANGALNGSKQKPAAAKAAARRPAPEPARTAARYVSNSHGQSAALAEWAREQPEYTRGVQRLPVAASGRAPKPAPLEEEIFEEEYDEEPPVYEDEDVLEEQRQPIRRVGRSDRWVEPSSRKEPPAPFRLEDWLGWLGPSDQVRIRVLGIFIGALFVVLVGVGAYLLGAHSSRGVTFDIGVRREVSDAATAARIPTDKVQVAQTFAVFDGRDPTIFSTAPDNPIQFDNANAFARISSSAGTPGIKVMIGPGLAARLAGHQIRVVISARASVDGGAANMRFAYQSGLAISHWQTANLLPDYQQLGIVWRVPTMRTSPNGDFLLIEPGIPGDGTAVDVQSIRIDVLAS